MKHIICRLFGGLGNQIFIYAANRALSIEKNAQLILDSTSGFKNDKKFGRSFRLKIQHSCAREKNFGKTWFILKRTQYLHQYFGRFLNYSYQNHTKNLTATKKYNFTEGYWQDFNLFKSQSHQIKEELLANTFNEVRTSAYTPKKNSLGIHIRQKQISRPLSIEYYKAAISKALENKFVKDVVIVGDDQDFCIEVSRTINQSVNVKIQNGKSDITDFYTFGKCEIRIAANSTFSVASAWLFEAKSDSTIIPNLKEITTMNPPQHWLTI
ncbi:alpha-1,2-fucosyltransferase [Pelagicoccus enzymogenes]|uniref:alpha-1,2-fucosyltransferase n=1 Tax=Pelagicoccus enzymogenes TaxID=2773457 RepID=UPI00280C5315|nr:alpha-1,2-fucosyltransferase [Pelagicoccus enzymogenes]MDQ8199775.1 alpha-1,2-fucosyltransferase [Pelagicoccus enzymogenes]